MTPLSTHTNTRLIPPSQIDEITEGTEWVPSVPIAYFFRLADSLRPRFASPRRIWDPPLHGASQRFALSVIFDDSSPKGRAKKFSLPCSYCFVINWEAALSIMRLVPTLSKATSRRASPPMGWMDRIIPAPKAVWRIISPLRS